MKKSTKILISLLAIFIVGSGIVMGTNKDVQKYLAGTTVKSDKERQIEYLKAHEQEIVDFVKSQNSKVKSVQIDWDSMDVGIIGNGLPQGDGYRLTVQGGVNELVSSNFTVGFRLEHEDELPKMQEISLMDGVRILNGKVWEYYE